MATSANLGLVARVLDRLAIHNCRRPRQAKEASRSALWADTPRPVIGLVMRRRHRLAKRQRAMVTGKPANKWQISRVRFYRVATVAIFCVRSPHHIQARPNTPAYSRNEYAEG